MARVGQQGSHKHHQKGPLLDEFPFLGVMLKEDIWDLCVGGHQQKLPEDTTNSITLD